MIYAPLGTISHATLRTRDLLEEFEWVLRHLAERNLKQAPDEEMFKRHLRLCEDARKLLEILGEQDWDEDQEEEAGVLVNEDLFEALNDYAAPYVYFGTNEGDGADFGFWPSISSLQEDSRGRHASVLRIEAGTEWPRDREGQEAYVRAAGWSVEDCSVEDQPAFAVLQPGGKPIDGPLFHYEWEAWDKAAELAKVRPPLPVDVEYVMEVTDHGNVSLYDREGKELWSCV
jgi:hypothetical protein